MVAGRTWRVLLVAAVVAAQGQSPAPANLAALRRSFAQPPADSRIMMRWWWFGPAVTKPELEREMLAMKQAGIGGFEIQPVYPLALDDPARGIRNLPFGSPEFLDALHFASEKARELGLRADLTLGSGWPYGGPHISRGLAAARLRVDRAQVPAGQPEAAIPLAEGEKLIAAFVAEGSGWRELKLLGDRSAAVPPSLSEPQTALFFASSRTGMMVKRPAVGAEGLVLDHYDAADLRCHLASVGEPLLKAFGAHPPYAVFSDSLEVYGSDWTGDFLDQFQKRRGYDLKPHLPALIAGVGPETGAVRNDWGLTLTELAEERFLAPLEEWARRNGTRFRSQTYGTPPVALSSNRLVDLPEGEGAHWKRFTPTRWASSAAHLYGRPVASSETWTWLHSPSFRATPLDMKAEADRHFLQGINQLIGHGWPYSPETAAEPGWHFYAAGAFNRHNPWWIVMPDLALYLQRVSFLLRQGAPANDVALYLPTSDARATFVAGQTSLSEAVARILDRSGVIPQILEAGFNFDFIDDTAIQDYTRIDAGALAIGACRFHVLILPAVERMPVETYRKIQAFAQAGGIVIATDRTPSLAPGLMRAQAETTELQAISHRLFDGPAATAHLVAGANGELRVQLRKLRPPDVTLSPPAPEIGFVHRTAGSAEVYFLANTGNVPLHTTAAFRVRGKRPEWWDPFTGRTAPARVTIAGDWPSVALDLEPYESRILVFAAEVPPPGAGSPAEPRLPAPLDLSRNWTVTFAGPPGALRFETLHSWTENPETRLYSGVATYEKKFSAPENMALSGLALYLDFGEGTPVPETDLTHAGMRAWLESPVREAAVVYINGQRAGSVWRPPYRVEVGSLLHAGENTIRMAVGNLAVNSMAGRRPPDYEILRRRYGRRFDPEDTSGLQPLPSGLLGSVRLLAVAARPGDVSFKPSIAAPVPYASSGGAAAGASTASARRPKK